jgi:hypothetical protein
MRKSFDEIVFTHPCPLSAPPLVIHRMGSVGKWGLKSDKNWVIDIPWYHGPGKEIADKLYGPGGEYQGELDGRGRDVRKSARTHSMAESAKRYIKLAPRSHVIRSFLLLLAPR